MKDDSAIATVERSPQRVTPRVLVIAGLALFVVGLGVLALMNRGDETTIETLDDSTVSVPEEESTVTTVPTEANGTTDNCDARATAAVIAQGLPLLEFDPTASPNDLVDRSVAVVRGHLLTKEPGPDGSILPLKVREILPASFAEQRAVTDLWIPAAGPTSEFFEVNFVAFLNGEEVPLGSPGLSVSATHVEGLWIACDDSSPAVSVLANPTESGWQVAIDAGITLDELWDIALFPEGDISEPLGPPVGHNDGADIFDLTLFGGERFRLSLPEGLGDDLLVVQGPDSNGVSLESPELQLTIDYGFCRTPDGLSINALGMEVVRIDDGLSVACRSDELLSMSIEGRAVPTAADLDLVDLRPISAGGDYGDTLRDFWPELRECSNCSPCDPMVFPEQNIVVNRTGQTSFTAVALDSLVEVWTIDTGGFGTQMQAGADSVYLSDPAGPFIRIEAETGQQLWSINIADEHGADISFTAPGRLLLSTSFATEGDNRAPVVRSIDDQSGEVLWTASGRESAEWQFTTPVVYEGVAILMDVYDDPAVPDGGPGAVLHAFDLETGELAWTTELESTPAQFSSGLLVVSEFENGKALIARTVDGDVLRIDPTDGAILWLAQIGARHIGGTAFDDTGALAISTVTATGQVLLNPTSGDVVS